MTVVKGPASQYLETSSSSFHSIHLYKTVIQRLLLSRFVSRCFRENQGLEQPPPLTGPNLEQDHAHCLRCFSLLFPEIILRSLMWMLPVFQAAMRTWWKNVSRIVTYLSVCKKRFTLWKLKQTMKPELQYRCALRNTSINILLECSPQALENIHRSFKVSVQLTWAVELTLQS